MKAAIIYTSVTGNTSTLAEIISEKMAARDIETDLIPVDEFRPALLHNYDIVTVGTYSWDNGDLPLEMEEVFEAFETEDLDRVITGVFGTGDSFYPYYCGAVDLFRDMLYVHTKLAVTLKVELTPQDDDLHRCEKFCDRLTREFAVFT
ncbi:flavodoxin domain-containing protein [Gracilibacillus caseinilyticus]|uniref:Flavodoxin domain-containing protein n=1 Tax=Gracilibacillus caseinilyticus TaxID=2932256 RepID=A0ABY4EWB7_9BACI|nr:flavodoxin domain-containing protein [Gracilibacillus caseinilyticus]UOQ48523.1 flavodoxin domain-containing protein [Gracilibacillus caseinilyticus]